MKPVSSLAYSRLYESEYVHVKLYECSCSCDFVTFTFDLQAFDLLSIIIIVLSYVTVYNDFKPMTHRPKTTPENRHVCHADLLLQPASVAEQNRIV